MLQWQIKSRIDSVVEFEWVGGSKLLVERGMTGATGNIYCGLHEFEDMAFLLHCLKEGDLFLDVGANIGSYTVLAAAAKRANVISIEPHPITMTKLKKNLVANNIDGRVRALEVALGSKSGKVNFTTNLDTMNRVMGSADRNTKLVEMKTLDAIVGDESPAFIKLDVEGFEADVISGATKTLSNPSVLAIETESRDAFVVSTLVEAGFQEYVYEPFSRAINLGSGTSNNALFIRDISEIERRVSSSPRYSIFGQQI